MDDWWVCVVHMYNTLLLIFIFNNNMQKKTKKSK
jgi:hypothetical protein